MFDDGLIQFFSIDSVRHLKGYKNHFSLVKFGGDKTIRRYCTALFFGSLKKKREFRGNHISTTDKISLFLSFLYFIHYFSFQ